MSSSDTIPDVIPDVSSAPPEPPKTSVVSTSTFFPIVLVCFGYLIALALSWQAILLLFGSRMTEVTVKVLFYLWMIPVLAVFSSFFFPSAIATTGWVAVVTPLTLLPLAAAFGYVLLFGTRTSPQV